MSPAGIQWSLLGLFALSASSASGLSLDVTRELRRWVTVQGDSAVLASGAVHDTVAGHRNATSDGSGSIHTSGGSANLHAGQDLVLRDVCKTARQCLYVSVKDTTKFIVGVALVLFSVPALWFYERQRARVECLLAIARSSCHSVVGLKAASENCGLLLHATGEMTRPTAAVRDPRFPSVVIKEDCVRMRTEVQVYQFVERRLTSAQQPGKSDLFQAWSSEAEHTLKGLQDWSKQSAALPGVRIGTTVTNCGRVELGANFLLPDALVDQCRNFQSAAHLLGPSVTTCDNQLTFQKHADGYFYGRHGEPCWSATSVAEAPRLGDVRARFEYVPPGLVTVLALQVGAEADGGRIMTFAPFRHVPRGLCGLGQHEEREALVQESKKSREQLAREDQCLPGSRLCCGCNLVARCCSGVLTPEIFRLFEGTRTTDECLLETTPSGGPIPWAVRGFLWIATCIGFILMAFAVQIVAPWLSEWPLAALFGGWTRLTVCVSLSLTISAFIVCFAYFPFRPLMAILGFCVICTVVLVPNILAFVLVGNAVLLSPAPEDNPGVSARPDVGLFRLRGPGVP
mmetsp:Transcript_14769/g.40789  ORF Transcript_14769/g.40789 Transcript_14769/m.40789 type:complete len:570 (-) Transcript_14769:248-1957(-)